MSNPPPEPTNLTQKFVALQELLTTQYNALRDDIAALRGTGGPENTLRSINQSIWNLAGAAPGASLAQILAAVNLIRGPVPAVGDPDTRIGLVQLASALGGGKSLASLFGQWDAGAGISPYELLSNIYTALTNSGLSQTTANDILTRLIAQFDTAVVTPTMKDLLVGIKSDTAIIAGNTADPLTASPAGACDTPLMNTGTEYVSITMQFVEPFTLATWSDTVPSGFSGITIESGGLAVGNTKVVCTDWSQYKIYVASKSSQFGVSMVNLQRFDTNKWITLSGNNFFEIYVNGNENLKVYICPTSSSPTLLGCPGASDPLGPTGWMAVHDAQGVLLTDNWAGNGFTGGSSWSLPITIPSQYDQVAAFSIAGSGSATLCIAWTGFDPNLWGVDLAQYMLIAGVWELRGGGLSFVTPGGSAASGNIQHSFNAGSNYAYILRCFGQGTPPGIVSISLL
jgi:hypothetical protein